MPNELVPLSSVPAPTQLGPLSLVPTRDQLLDNALLDLDLACPAEAERPRWVDLLGTSTSIASPSVGKHYKAVIGWLRPAGEPAPSELREETAADFMVLGYSEQERAVRSASVYYSRLQKSQESLFRANVVLRELTVSGIKVEGRVDFVNYLVHHLDLGSVLASVCGKVREAFGPIAELSMALYKDPENQDQYLSLYVRLPKYESGILSRIETVASQFATQLEALSGNLLITTDFRRPRG